LSLTLPEKNLMKEITKSSIVKDILGYEAPHYIKPTGYLEPLGDKKFVSMYMEYRTFNDLKDEIYINVRMNDSPALAGLLIDLVRLGKICIERGLKGTIYQVNSFYMKKPGPPGSKSIAKILAFQKLKEWLKSINELEN
ncbi:MAG: myo-inositol-1-phosphate synthase, partial [Candidatus Methanomethylicia archaeon]